MNSERQPRSASPGAKLMVGETVVYAGHGPVRVTAHELRTILGVEQEVVVVETNEGLVVTLPIERARERLRPIASRADVQRVQQTLGQQGKASNDHWEKRFKRRKAILASGDLLGLAEIVRDGIRQMSETASSRLSARERQLHVQARQFLAQEIAAACELEVTDADTWIDQQAASA